MYFFLANNMVHPRSNKIPEAALVVHEFWSVTELKWYAMLPKRCGEVEITTSQKSARLANFLFLVPASQGTRTNSGPSDWDYVIKSGESPSSREICGKYQAIGERSITI